MTKTIVTANQFANLIFNLHRFSKEDLFNLLKNNLQNEESFLHLGKLESNYKVIAFIILKLASKDSIASKNLDSFFSTFTEARELVEKERETSWQLLEYKLLKNKKLVKGKEHEEAIKENLYAFKCFVLRGTK
jgi:hypothetical protein